MGLRLSVRRDAWRASVDAAAAARPDLVPVVKGNGYGFGRPMLMPIAAELSPSGLVAVGTVYEAADVPVTTVALVLTPHVDRLPPWLARGTILTVGAVEHVRALQRQGWTGRVVIKLQSSMRRFGVCVDDLAGLAEAATAADLDIVAYDIHLPLAGSDEDRIREVDGWVERVDPALPISVSHLAPDAYATLRERYAGRRWSIRCGTALWHADKTTMHLTADVLQIHPVRAGDVAGYRGTEVSRDGTVIVVGCGSANGVRALEGGLSPFHHARTRLDLLEPPHMHASLAFVPDGAPCPAVGDRVDVQRPLIETSIDELAWLDG